MNTLAQFADRPKLLSQEVLERFKYEVAEELGLAPQVADGYWGELPARDCGRVGGRIGGRMVRVMVRWAEEAMAHGRRI